MIPGSLLEAAEINGRREVVEWDLVFCRNTDEFDPFVTTFADNLVYAITSGAT